MTLLDIVQDIMNDLDTDEVNSIFDTVESQQVAQIVKSTYYAIISNRNWPHTKRGISLEAPGSTATPTHMKLADTVKELCFVNYNKANNGETRRRYDAVKWREPDDFLRYLNQRDSDQDNIDIIQDPSGIELLIRNDLAPSYYTSFDDSTLVFDSYDSSVNDTLVSTKVQANGYVIPSWSMVDEFIPDLPDEAFTLLTEEAKSKASVKLRQVEDPKAEQEAGRQNRWLSRKAWRVEGGIQYPNYGRNTQKYQSNFDKNNRKPN